VREASSYHPGRSDVSMTYSGRSHRPSSCYWDGTQLSCAPDDTIHASGINGVDVGAMELDVVSHVDTVLCIANLSGCSTQICQWCSFNMVSIEWPIHPRLT
jgi:hypothetical protein